MKTYKTTCSWPDCGQRVEFDETLTNTIILCPSCNRNVYLVTNNTPIIDKRPTYRNPENSLFDKILNLIPKQDPDVEQLRNKSYYKFTRAFITLIQWCFYITACLIFIGYLTSFIQFKHTPSPADENISSGFTILPIWAWELLGTFWAVVFLGFVGTLWKETSSLLVDIADVQIGIYKKNK